MTDIGHFFFFHSVNPGSSIDRSRKVGDEFSAQRKVAGLSSYFRVLSSLSLSSFLHFNSPDRWTNENDARGVVRRLNYARESANPGCSRSANGRPLLDRLEGRGLRFLAD